MQARLKNPQLMRSLGPQESTWEIATMIPGRPTLEIRMFLMMLDVKFEDEPKTLSMMVGCDSAVLGEKGREVGRVGRSGGGG